LGEKLAARARVVLTTSMPGQKNLYSVSQVADILSVSKSVVRKWEKSGKLVPRRAEDADKRIYAEEDLRELDTGNLFFGHPVRRAPGTAATLPIDRTFRRRRRDGAGT
jgi:hypothetical protein